MMINLSGMRVKTIIRSFLMALCVIPVAHALAADKPDHDVRTNLKFTPAEKAVFLSEMRQMLASIQGILAGIGEEDRALIIKSARYSGNRMARETPDSIKSKTPPSFKEIGGPTHMMFEELAVRAQEDDMDMVAAFTGELMQNCLSCHSMFRVN